MLAGIAACIVAGYLSIFVGVCVFTVGTTDYSRFAVWFCNCIFRPERI